MVHTALSLVHTVKFEQVNAEKKKGKNFEPHNKPKKIRFVSFSCREAHKMQKWDETRKEKHTQCKKKNKRIKKTKKN